VLETQSYFILSLSSFGINLCVALALKFGTANDGKVRHFGVMVPCLLTSCRWLT